MNYEDVNALWPVTPPLTRAEAEKARKRLARHFKIAYAGRVRACWISSEKTANREDRGWRRLVHDISHRHARQQFPTLRPHGPHHVKVEGDMVAYVLAQGWLAGKLRPAPPQRKPIDKLDHARAGMKRWVAKVRRAETILRKWQRRVRYYEAKAAAA